MGYDATSGEKNTTGLADQLQALSFAGSTLKPGKPLKMELSGYVSRIFGEVARLGRASNSSNPETLSIPSAWARRRQESSGLWPVSARIRRACHRLS